MPNTTYYFMPLTELEFLLITGISQAVKKTNGGKTVLLHTAHPRIVNKMQNYYDQFDEVIQLPFCDYQNNLIKGYKKFLIAWSIVRKLPFDSDRVLFNCSGRQLINMLVLHHFRKKRGQTRTTFAQILPYPDAKAGMPISLRRSLPMNAYSLFLGKMIFYRHEPGYPDYYGYISKPDWDVKLYVEHEGNAEKGLNFQNTPSTLEFIDTKRLDDAKCNDFDKPGVIVFVDDRTPHVYGLSEKGYWEFIKILCSHISQKMCLPVYVKMHPACPDNLLKEKGIDAIILNKNIVAEEYYLLKRKQILGIFSTGSTALLSGAWLGIPAFNFSALVGYEAKMLSRMLTYLAHPAIKHLTCIADLKNLKFPPGSANAEKQCSKEATWAKIITKISECSEKNT